jgi:hypothetical protein
VWNIREFLRIFTDLKTSARFQKVGMRLGHVVGVPALFRFSWKWRRRSPSKVKERTHLITVD